MNREVLETNWAQIRTILSEKFSNLSDEDIRQINGRYDQLVAKLQQKYGYSKEEAEERIRNWNFDRLAATKGQTMRDERIGDERVRRDFREDRLSDERSRKESDAWSVTKWLLAIGIPLLLLGSYFLSTRTPEATNAPVVTQERIVAETPADRAIINGLRNALLSQQVRPIDLQNVRISANNGIITLSGTVPNQETRNTISSTAQNFEGVRQVINNLQVR